jgi:hypothetical protein
MFQVLVANKVRKIPGARLACFHLSFLLNRAVLLAYRYNTGFDVIIQWKLSTDSFMNAAGAMFLPYTQTVRESLGLRKLREQFSGNTRSLHFRVS